MLINAASRFAAAAICATALVGLSSCGGGGGGTSGGGGGIPTTAPTGTGSPPPLTPTPVPTPTPMATPTPVPTATPGPPTPSGQTIRAGQGDVNGQPGAYTPLEGNTPTGGQGTPVDGVTCDPTMSNNYHVHAFIAVYNNGTYVALPAGTGMVNPQPPDKTGFVNFASCFYHLHTHDSSGIIHIEDPSLSTPITASLYALKTYLDIWGITTDAKHFGPFTGPVRVFTSGQVYRGNQNNGVVPASTLTFFGTDATKVPLYSHELIFVEVGPNFPASLPNVSFYTQF